MLHETCLKTAKATSARQCDIADIWWATWRFWFIYDECRVARVASFRLFHLPEILQSFHHVHCTQHKTCICLWTTKLDCSSTILIYMGKMYVTCLTHCCYEQETGFKREASCLSIIRLCSTDFQFLGDTRQAYKTSVSCASLAANYTVWCLRRWRMRNTPKISCSVTVIED